MNSHAPTLSSAPPVSACPLVHPRASTAPTPITAPPAPAAHNRGDTAACGPRSTRTASRPASAAEHHPPIITPRISTTSQSRNSPPASRCVARKSLRDAHFGRHAAHRRRCRGGERAARAEPAPGDHERREQHQPERHAGEIRIGVRPHSAVIPSERSESRDLHLLLPRAHCALSLPARGSSTGSSAWRDHSWNDPSYSSTGCPIARAANSTAVACWPM